MIIGYVGKPGAGKTLLMTWDLVKAMKRERDVYANYPILGARFWEKLDDTYGIRSGVIAMDEAGSVVNSRKWEKLPDDVVKQWQQSRKLGLDLYFTAQAFTGVDKILRGITNYVWFCRKIFPGVCYAERYASEQAERVQNWDGLTRKPKPDKMRLFVPFFMRTAMRYDTMALVGDAPAGRVDPQSLRVIDYRVLGWRKAPGEFFVVKVRRTWRKAYFGLLRVLKKVRWYNRRKEDSNVSEVANFENEEVSGDRVMGQER